ncbi:hypothetical protein E4U14_001514 [Claviceps sp. LM454 group G7]|nr:hypothetical protein E4U14_001514 [Claviceps sp. LM454 group G7]
MAFLRSNQIYDIGLKGSPSHFHLTVLTRTLGALPGYDTGDSRDCGHYFNYIKMYDSFEPGSVISEQYLERFL